MLLFLILAAAIYVAGSLVVLIGLACAPLAYESVEGFQLGHSPDEDLPATFSWWSDGLNHPQAVMAKAASLPAALEQAVA